MLNTFVLQYLETALWSSNDNSDDSGGDPLDKNYGVEDIAPESVLKALSDCQSFREQAGSLLDGIEDSQAGHDFWLTRNHHGAGWWDRGLGEVGEKLTKLSHSFGSADPYIGDDGKIYIG